jgi:hypothetical protein
VEDNSLSNPPWSKKKIFGASIVRTMQLERNARRAKNAKTLSKDSLEGGRHRRTTRTADEPAATTKNVQMIARNVV